MTEIIAFVALLLTVMGGLWKMSALITRVQTTVEFIKTGLETNTRLTAQCADRISRLEGPTEPFRRNYTNGR